MRTNRYSVKSFERKTGFSHPASTVIESGRKITAADVENFEDRQRFWLMNRDRLRDLVWSYHLSTMLTAGGEGIIILSVFDEYTGECLCCTAGDNISIEKVLDELFSLFLQRAVPKQLVAFDDGGLVPNAISQWLAELELGCVLVKSNELDANKYRMSAGNRLLEELLTERSYGTLNELQLWLAKWKAEHNSALKKCSAPAAFKRRG